jgi:hypothetical protein
MPEDVRVLLDIAKFVAYRKISEEELPFRVDPKFYVAHEAEELVLRLQADVLSEKLPPATVGRDWDVVWPFPSSPWQFWKRRHGGAWWLAWFVRRWPVRVEPHRRRMHLEVDIERYRTFPESRIQLPDDTLGRPFLYGRATPLWEEGE